VAKVSIIVPVYNTEKYLHTCLDALTGQTLEDIELVLVNDGSTDGSQAILEEYQKKYPEKIKIFVKENGGQATARNLGIRECTGEYIGFADSDDYVDVTMFEKMYALAKEKHADMVECHFHYIQSDENGRKELPARGNVRKYGSQKNMFIDPQVSPWNKLYRREVLLDNGIDFPEGMIYEDTAFYIKTIPYVKTQEYLDEKLVYYMYRGNSTMNANKSRKVGDIFAVLQNIIDFYKDRGLYDTYAQEIEYFCVKILLCSSLSRIGRVTDKEIERELLDKTFAYVREYFPEYKKNTYFTGKIGIYIRFVKRWNSKYIGRVLGKVMKG